jgi:hypothetical protein
MLRAGRSEFVKVIISAAWSMVMTAMSLTEVRIWAFVVGNREILHYSIVTPSATHLPWLAIEEVGSEIGGCLTVPSSRGMKLYPYILQQICQRLGQARPLYMIVEENNASSRAGMRSAGFEYLCNLRRASRLGRPAIYARQGNC